MGAPTRLRGITWNHSRAFPPLIAAAQRYEELHPGVDVQWFKRSLHDFGHADLSALAQNFDLIVLDHPWAGEALVKGDLVMLDEIVDSLAQLHFAATTVASSFESYVLRGKLIALPIDVATQVASYRPDILERIGSPVPKTWEEVIALARQGRVLIPGFHVDVLLTFLGFCVSLGGEMFTSDGWVVSREAGHESLRRMAELSAYLPEETWDYNPIAVYERLASSEDFAYCPFAYGYHNYTREGFAANPLRFANLIQLPDGVPLRGVLGGTGIGISRRCTQPEAALAFCRYVASEFCQRHIYFLSGGQPAHVSAWKDPLVNGISADFFTATRRSTEEAWIRPRYDGYISFQESAGLPIVQYLREGGDAEKVLQALDNSYRDSLGAKSHA